MAVEQGIFQLICSNSDVQQAVGLDKNGTTKAHWVLAKQGSQIPYLVFSRVSTSDTYTLAGSSNFRNAVYQVSAYATDYYTSRNIANIVRLAIQDFTGTLPDGTVVQCILTEKDWDMNYEEGDKSFIFGSLMQFRVWYLG